RAPRGDGAAGAGRRRPGGDRPAAGADRGPAGLTAGRAGAHGVPAAGTGAAEVGSGAAGADRLPLGRLVDLDEVDDRLGLALDVEVGEDAVEPPRQPPVAVAE